MSDRYKVGDVVRAMRDVGGTDWQDNAAARKRPWGMLVTVLEVHDSHGIVYLCEYDTGFSTQPIWYEHDELAPHHPEYRMVMRRKPEW